MSYSLNSCKGVIYGVVLGSIIGVIKLRGILSLDYSLYWDITPLMEKSSGKANGNYCIYIYMYMYWNDGLGFRVQGSFVFLWERGLRFRV